MIGRALYSPLKVVPLPVCPARVDTLFLRVSLPAFRGEVPWPSNGCWIIVNSVSTPVEERHNECVLYNPSERWHNGSRYIQSRIAFWLYCTLYCKLLKCKSHTELIKPVRQFAIKSLRRDSPLVSSNSIRASSSSAMFANAPTACSITAAWSHLYKVGAKYIYIYNMSIWMCYCHLYIYNVSIWMCYCHLYIYKLIKPCC